MNPSFKIWFILVCFFCFNVQLQLGVDESYTLMVSKNNELSIVGAATIEVRVSLCSHTFDSLLISHLLVGFRLILCMVLLEGWRYAKYDMLEMSFSILIMVYTNLICINNISFHLFA